MKFVLIVPKMSHNDSVGLKLVNLWVLMIVYHFNVFINIHEDIMCTLLIKESKGYV